MIYDASVSNLIIREWLNGSLFPLSLNLAVIIGVFIWDSFVHSLEDGTPRWWRLPGVPTACVLFWIFGMESVRAISVWAILHTTNQNKSMPDWVVETATYSLVLASIVLLVALLRCTYLFSPPKWGHAFWIYSAVSTLLFLLLSNQL